MIQEVFNCLKIVKTRILLVLYWFVGNCGGLMLQKLYNLCGWPTRKRKVDKSWCLKLDSGFRRSEVRWLNETWAIAIKVKQPLYNYSLKIRDKRALKVLKLSEFQSLIFKYSISCQTLSVTLDSYRKKLPPNTF